MTASRPHGRSEGGQITVFLSSIKWDFVWQRHQALAVAAAASSPVVFVQSQPRSWNQLAHLVPRALRRLRDRGQVDRSSGPANPRPDAVELVRASPLAVLWPGLWARTTARSILTKHPGATVDTVLYAPTAAYIALARRLERSGSGGRVSYDAVVDWSTVPDSWWPPPQPRRAEASLPDHWRVTSDSRGLGDTLSAAMQRSVDIVLPAADPAFAEQAWDRARQRSDTLGWFGVVRDETDVDLLAACARAGLVVETIGPVERSELAQQLEGAGVTVRPAVSVAALPEAMAHWSGVLCAYRGARASTITPAKIFNALAGFTVFTRGLHLPPPLCEAAVALPDDDEAAVALIRRRLAAGPASVPLDPVTWSDRLEEILGRSARSRRLPG